MRWKVWEGGNKVIVHCCWTGGSRHHPVLPWLCDEAAATGLLFKDWRGRLTGATIDWGVVSQKPASFCTSTK